MAELIRMPGVGDWVDGRFLLQQCLGRGGYGVVYKARQKGLRRHVAVKMLLPHALEQPIVMARFQREANLASSLHHPNTVMIHTFGVHTWHDDAAGVPFLVMEYLTGEVLQSYLNRIGLLPPDAAMDILLQVLGSLGEAHAQGIIHRDIKPGNIFVCTRSGRPNMVKVLDFGIAKLFETEEHSSITGTGVTPGTVDYMAPDLALGESTQTPAIDVYAIGCMAFRMVMGQVPYIGKTPLEVSIKHVNSPVPAMTPALEAHPIAGLIRRAMAKKPAERFQDAGEFARAIAKVRGDQPPWSASWAGLPAIQVSQTPNLDAMPMQTMEDGGAVVPNPEDTASVVARPTLPPSPTGATVEQRESVHLAYAEASGFDPPRPRIVRRRWADILALLLVGVLLSMALLVVVLIAKEDQRVTPVAGATPMAPKLPPDTRMLRVDSDPPGASIYLKEKRLGITPLTFAHPFGDGPLQLTLFKKDYQLEDVSFDTGSSNEAIVQMSRNKPNQGKRKKGKPKLDKHKKGKSKLDKSKQDEPKKDKTPLKKAKAP